MSRKMIVFIHRRKKPGSIQFINKTETIQINYYKVTATVLKCMSMVAQ